jgi:hypothetical protein
MRPQDTPTRIRDDHRWHGGFSAVSKYLHAQGQAKGVSYSKLPGSLVALIRQEIKTHIKLARQRTGKPVWLR